MSEYIMNKETGKIELHFDKADYLALAEDQKKDIKSNYLFSRVKRAWVSRAKFPNLYRAEKVANWKLEVYHGEYKGVLCGVQETNRGEEPLPLYRFPGGVSLA